MINIDFNNIIGKIKPMHAVGQPPIKGGFYKLDFSHLEYLKDSCIPYSRLHDVGGPFGSSRYVDIPNVFRNFDADENNPDSYDFAFTDALIEGLYNHNIEPIYRLGVTIENQAHIKAYHIYPPKDFNKWSRICEHIIRHYNEGWANGFHYGIKYWEIWNEPENGPEGGPNQMWLGTKEEFFELYTVTSKHLKSCFGNDIKIGGYGSCGFGGIYFHPDKYKINVEPVEYKNHPSYDKEMYRVNFLFMFLEYIKKHDAPLDFFSWHSYSNVKKTAVMAEFLDRVLDEYGFLNVETHLNEWNNAWAMSEKGTSFASANTAAQMLSMQNMNTDILCYYDAKIGIGNYAGMFDTGDGYKPLCTYYAFKAFGELYKLKNQVTCDCDIDNLYAVAAKDNDKKAIMIVNISDEDKSIQLNLNEKFDAYLLDEQHFLTKECLNPDDFILKKNQVILLKNYN